jgi:hypothetical protein
VSRIFPKWMNAFPTVAAVGTLGLVTAASAGYLYYFTPAYWRVGYMPTQPSTGFSHQIHAGKLGMDCRYCHTKVEQSYEANIPNVATCMGCHTEQRLKGWDVHKVQFVREAYAKNESVEWRRIHKIPEYAHFPHNVHLRAGVSCYSCHGQIAGMPIVYEAKSLAMGWCLECHRNAAPSLVPKDVAKFTEVVKVEKYMTETPEGKRADEGRKIIENLKLNPPQNCGACHY